MKKSFFKIFKYLSSKRSLVLNILIFISSTTSSISYAQTTAPREAGNSSLRSTSTSSGAATQQSNFQTCSPSLYRWMRQQETGRSSARVTSFRFIGSIFIQGIAAESIQSCRKSYVSTRDFRTAAEFNSSLESGPIGQRLSTNLNSHLRSCSFANEEENKLAIAQYYYAQSRLESEMKNIVNEMLSQNEYSGHIFTQEQNRSNEKLNIDCISNFTQVSSRCTNALRTCGTNSLENYNTYLEAMQSDYSTMLDIYAEIRQLQQPHWRGGGYGAAPVLVLPAEVKKRVEFLNFQADLLRARHPIMEGRAFKQIMERNALRSKQDRVNAIADALRQQLLADRRDLIERKNNIERISNCLSNQDAETCRPREIEETIQQIPPPIESAVANSMDRLRLDGQRCIEDAIKDRDETGQTLGELTAAAATLPVSWAAGIALKGASAATASTVRMNSVVLKYTQRATAGATIATEGLLLGNEISRAAQSCEADAEKLPATPEDQACPAGHIHLSKQNDKWMSCVLENVALTAGLSLVPGVIVARNLWKASNNIPTAPIRTAGPQSSPNSPPATPPPNRPSDTRGPNNNLGGPPAPATSGNNTVRPANADNNPTTGTAQTSSRPAAASTPARGQTPVDNADRIAAEFRSFEADSTLNPVLARARVEKRIEPTSGRTIDGYTGENNNGIEILRGPNGEQLFAKITRNDRGELLSVASEREIFFAQKLSDMGLGPKFYGTSRGADGNLRIVTQHIDGFDIKVTDAGRVIGSPEALSNRTLEQIQNIQRRLINEGINPQDLNFRIDRQTGQAYVVDPATFTPILSDQIPTVQRRLDQQIQAIRSARSNQILANSRLGDTERVSRLENILGVSEGTIANNPRMRQAVLDAHNSPGTVNNLTPGQIRERVRILQNAGFQKHEIRNGLQAGIFGNAPETAAAASVARSSAAAPPVTQGTSQSVANAVQSGANRAQSPAHASILEDFAGPTSMRSPDYNITTRDGQRLVGQIEAISADGSTVLFRPRGSARGSQPVQISGNNITAAEKEVAANLSLANSRARTTESMVTIPVPSRPVFNRQGFSESARGQHVRIQYRDRDSKELLTTEGYVTRSRDIDGAEAYVLRTPDGEQSVSSEFFDIELVQRTTPNVRLIDNGRSGNILLPDQIRQQIPAGTEIRVSINGDGARNLNGRFEALQNINGQEHLILRSSSGDYTAVPFNSVSEIQSVARNPETLFSGRGAPSARELQRNAGFTPAQKLETLEGVLGRPPRSLAGNQDLVRRVTEIERQFPVEVSQTRAVSRGRGQRDALVEKRGALQQLTDANGNRIFTDAEIQRGMDYGIFGNPSAAPTTPARIPSSGRTTTPKSRATEILESAPPPPLRQTSREQAQSSLQRAQERLSNYNYRTSNEPQLTEIGPVHTVASKTDDNFRGARNSGIEIIEGPDRPLFAKITEFAENANNRNQRSFQNEVFFTQYLSDIGKGPDFHGIFVRTQRVGGPEVVGSGQYRIMTDAVPGNNFQLSETTRDSVRRFSHSDIDQFEREAVSLVKDHGLSPGDFQARIARTSDGSNRVYVVDPAMYSFHRGNTTRPLTALETSFREYRAQKVVTELVDTFGERSVNAGLRRSLETLSQEQFNAAYNYYRNANRAERQRLLNVPVQQWGPRPPGR